MIIAEGGPERVGSFGVKERQVVAVLGEPGRDQPVLGNGQVESPGGEQEVIAPDDALEQFDPLGGLGRAVLVEQKDVRAAGDLERPAKGAVDRFQVGIRAGSLQPIEGRNHPGGRGPARVSQVRLAEQCLGLRRQAVRQRPPGGCDTDPLPPRPRGRDAARPLLFGPVTRHDLAEVARRELDRAAGKVETDRSIPAGLGRDLDPPALREIEQLRPQTGRSQHDQHDPGGSTIRHNRPDPHMRHLLRPPWPGARELSPRPSTFIEKRAANIPTFLAFRCRLA